MKDDGLISSHADFMALDERVIDDWRLVKNAEMQLAKRLAPKATR